MELTPLRYFREIARAGHLTRAAGALGVTQPALSAMLQKLEKEVGAALVHRSRRGVELTEAGRVFLAHAEEAVRAAESGARAVRQLAGLERGSIRVGGGATAASYLLPGVVSRVLAAHPGLRFYVREAGSSAVAAAVLSGELDLGIVTLPVVHPQADELVKVPLVEDELRLIVPPGHALGRSDGATPPRRRSDEGKRGRAKARTGEAQRGVRGGRGEEGGFRWKELEGEAIVAFEAGTAVRGMIDRASAAAGVTLNVVMELRSIESIKRMVGAGIGVGFVSRFALREGEGLVCREGKLSRQLAVVRRRDRGVSAAVGEFEGQLAGIGHRKGSRSS